MPKALTVSIVIPVYNEESYIGPCLDAIATQIDAVNEVIVVDNNSTDGTAAIAAAYPFVTLLHEPKQGVTFAHKTGMDAASGDVICRIDADTILSESWVRAARRQFADSSVVAATGPNGHHDFIFPDAGLWLQDKLLRGALLVGYDFMFGCNMAIRASVWRQIQPHLCHDTAFFEDMDMVRHMKQQQLRPVYNPAMKVMISARRAGDSIPQFLHYIHGHVRTARGHGQSVIGAYYAEVWFTLFYLAAKPLHRSFDPATRRPSLRKLIKPDAARPNPLSPLD